MEIFAKLFIWLTFVAVIPFGILLLYGSILKIREWKDIKKIRDQTISKNLTAGQIESRKDKTRKKLFGLLFSDILLYGTNFILALAAIATLASSSSANLAQLRPYLGIEYIKVEEKNEILNAETRIVNVGSVPANNLSILVRQFIDGELIATGNVEETKDVFLMPTPSYTIHRFSMHKNAENRNWSIEISLEYDGAFSDHHETKFSGRYKPETKSFTIFNGSIN